MLDVTVVVPVRNAAWILEDCLASIAAQSPREVIVVDGLSTDETLEIAARFQVRILSDEGRGLPAARLLGAEAAASARVAFVDADVVLPAGSLAALLDEFESDGYTALQAGLESVGGPGYWGRALAHHHRTGRSKHWFGLVATVFDREALLEHGFDSDFRSGEDIELRWRLQEAGLLIGVSARTVVVHRFDDGFAFARAQWLMDGGGLGRMTAKHGWRAKLLLGLPLAAAVRGIGLSIARREPRWIPYYLSFLAFNYVGLTRVLVRRGGDRLRSRKPRLAGGSP